MARLPSVTSAIPRDLQQFVQRVREALEGSGPDAVVTARQLIASGIASAGAGGGIVSPTPGVIDTPRAPRNVTTAGALATIIISWESANYSGHAYAEVWAASRTQEQEDATPPENPVLGQAQLVGMTAGNNFSHNIGGGAERWYWVRFINQNGVAGPYNLTDGTFGQTSQDPEYVLEVLTDAVTSSQLASSLLGNINTTFKQASAPTQKPDGSSLVTGDIWVDTSDDDRTYRWDADAGPGGTGAWVRIELTSFADVTNSITEQVGYCELTVVSGSTTTKSVSTANNTQTLCQAAQAASNKPPNYTYTWKDDGAIASELKTVTTTVEGNTATIQTNTESIDGIEANFTVKTDVGGHIAGFGLLNTARDATPTSEFGVRADKFFIAPPSTASNTAPTTNLFKGKVWVDTSSTPPVVKYYDPTANGGNGGWTTTQITNLPFIVNTTPTTINGQTVPAGAYIDTAFIADATITQAQIGTLNADVINSGLLNTVDFYGNTIAGSTIYLGGTITYTTDADGNNIGIASVTDANATLSTTGANFATAAFVINDGTTDYTPFQVVDGVAYLDNAMIKDSTLSFAKVSDNIQSTNYVASSQTNPAGWKLSKNGAFDLTSGTITAGTLQSIDGNFVIDLTNKTISIET